MKKTLPLCLFIASVSAIAGGNKATFKGTDLSGDYACTGHDAHDGDYKATVTLTLDKNNSQGNYGAYRFKMSADGYGTYLGSAVTGGDAIAITFTNQDASTKDYGTGIGKTVKGKDGKMRIEKFYYEPEYKNGSHGTETCIRK